MGCFCWSEAEIETLKPWAGLRYVSDFQNQPGIEVAARVLFLGCLQSKSTTGGTLATIESFTACVVGRRFQPKAECFDGEAVTFQHEASNVRDKNALLVVGSKGQVTCSANPARS
jgi:hypothetical protein